MDRKGFKAIEILSFEKRYFWHFPEGLTHDFCQNA